MELFINLLADAAASAGPIVGAVYDRALGGVDVRRIHERELRGIVDAPPQLITVLALMEIFSTSISRYVMDWIPGGAVYDRAHLIDSSKNARS